ncbi:XAC2610-related protein [Cystobacter fuscus]
MNRYPPRGLLAAFLLCTSSAANAESPARAFVRLDEATTGRVERAVELRIQRSADGEQGYSVKLSGKWRDGACRSADSSGLSALLVDFDFDGHADLWVTGFTDGQGRVRCSDVWLYKPPLKRYERHSELSSLQNLEIDPGARQLEGGMWNCGCAGMCFFHETYGWSAGALSKLSRRGQDCESEGIVYRESSVDSGAMKLTREVKGEPSSEEYDRRQKGSLKFLDWGSVKQVRQWDPPPRSPQSRNTSASTPSGP